MLRQSLIALRSLSLLSLFMRPVQNKPDVDQDISCLAKLACPSPVPRYCSSRIGLSREQREMSGHKRRQDSQRADGERIKMLKERVKAGNLPFHDPLTDGNLQEYRRVLSQNYRGFEVMMERGGFYTSQRGSSSHDRHGRFPCPLCP